MAGDETDAIDRAESPSPGGSPRPIVDLPSLLAPSTEDDFLRCFLGKERLSVRAAHPERAESLLPRWLLDRLLLSGFLPAARLVVLREGEVVAAGDYRDDEGRLRPGALEALASAGVSFVVQGIDEDVPAIASLGQAIEQRLGHEVWVNAYVTHGAGGALAPHYDDHDVIALQVHGAKRWFGHGTPHPSPIEPSPDAADFGPARWDVLLEPGDALYLPRGEVHHTSVEGALSVHLTFGIDTRRGVDFLASLVEAAALDATFRSDLTRLGGPEGLARTERELKDRMHALVDRADLDAFLRADEALRSRAARR